MNWTHPSPFTVDVIVQSNDIDQLNHTNNTRYINWCENVAWLHSKSLGLDAEDYQSIGFAMALHNAEYSYFLPTYIDDTLAVATWLVSCDGKLRLERQFEIINTRTEKTVMLGKWSLVCINLKNGKASRFPEVFRTAYAERSFPVGKI